MLEALDPARYEVTQVAIGRDGRWALGRGEERPRSRRQCARHRDAARARGLEAGRGARRVDVVLPVLHGPFGEDGTVQGLLELAGIPYVGAGVAASALCMDKDLFKAVLRDRGIPVARNVTLRLGDESRTRSATRCSSSRPSSDRRSGSRRRTTPRSSTPAVALARRHDEKVLVEEFVAGTEVECGVLGNLRPPPVASVVGEIVPHAEWYDYAAKYDEGGSDIIVPARIPDEIAARVQELAVDSFIATECEGMARVDFFVREDGEVVVNEINTIPGFTSTSVYARLFEASGIPYPSCSTA